MAKGCWMLMVMVVVIACQAGMWFFEKMYREI